jgi:prepilin-type N-terminal cleavage/methylation domain-containing protein
MLTYKFGNERRAFTIVELLVVIAILAIMAAILIPQVRIFNKDRGIREAARAVASVIQEASMRARERGFGGVAIVRNRNYMRVGSKPDPILYSSNVMYQARMVGTSPQLRSNSKITLPTGYRIDLNYSGPLETIDDTDPNTWTLFTANLDPVGPLKPNESPIYILFDETGGLEGIHPNGDFPIGTAPLPMYTHESIYLCVTEDDTRYSYDPASIWPRSASETPPKDLLDDPNILWVQVNCLTGKVAVLESIPPALALNTANPNAQQTRILQSRGIAVKGVNAAQ